jgi:hypothetical protein
VICGQETGNRKDKIEPKREWVEDLIDQADAHQIPIFLKNNLRVIAPEPSAYLSSTGEERTIGKLRQEFPKAMAR